MKGIDPRARARAKTAARKEGVTLGEWLNRVILDDNDPAGPQWDDALEAFPGFSGGQAFDGDEDRLLRAMVNRLTDRVESSEAMSAKTLGNLDRAINQLAERIAKDDTTRAQEIKTARDALDQIRIGQDELGDRIRDLESRPAGTASTDRAVETSIMKLARRLYEHENDTAARLHAVDEDQRRSSETLESRLARLESRADDFAELSKKREDRTAISLQDMQRNTDSLRARVESTERIADKAGSALEGSLSKLDDRLRSLETRNSSETLELERRFDRLSNEVATIIADTRAQMTKAVDKAAAEPRVEKLEAALTQALERIGDAERRQTESMSRLGEEITKLAGAIDRRLTESEQRATELRRDSEKENQLERRFDEVRDENRQAIRKMGDEVTRLGRSLADRIVKSEERTNEMVDTATERMAQMLDRFDENRGAREEDLEARLRQSEERTAQRIEDALSGVQERMATVRADTEDALSPVQRAMSALADRLEAIEARTPAKPSGKPASEATDDDAGTADEDTDFSKPLGPPPQAETPTSRFESDVHDPFLEPDPAPVAAPILRERPTPQPKPQAKAKPAAAPRPAPQPRRIGATADPDFLAAARERSRLTANSMAAGAQRQHSKLGRSLLYALPVVALIMLTGAGVILVWEATQSDSAATRASLDDGGRDFIAQVEAGLAETTPALSAPAQAAPRQTVAEQRAAEASAATASGAPDRPGASQSAPARTQAPSNVMADASNTSVPAPSNSPARSVAPVSSAPTSAVTLESAAAEGDPVARYMLGMRAIEDNDPATAAILLRRAAEQGVPAAQYRYAKLLESGEGVEIDLEEARRWTERAANAGHRRAMHNLGVMHYYGTGVSTDTAQAARWFQEAALLGLQDSQFNLALLYETGDGVPLSLPDAYAWFTIASTDGDPTASQRAAAIEEMIEPDALAAAQATAASFTPRAIDAEANGLYSNMPWQDGTPSDPAMVRRAQGFLSVLGYTPGPIDGMIGTQTRDAIMQFENDQGLSPTGRIDAALLEQLAQAAAG
ncbi:peptidoglycan-binding protein [Maricaulis sp. CAU 1757]